MSNVRNLLNEKFVHVNDRFPVEETLKVLEITLDNNAFQFGDTYWKQLRGMAMGAPVACVIATLFFACNEIKHLLPKFAKWMMLLLRYVDDGLMIWRADTSEPSSCMAFEHFITDINSHTYLTWTISPLLTKVTFLDLTIEITDMHEVILTPCAKPFHLYQHVPRQSAHPPGIIKGTIKGILQTYWLHSTNKATYRLHANNLCKRLIESNHHPSVAFACFKEAAMCIQQRLNTAAKFARALTKDNRVDQQHYYHYLQELNNLIIPSTTRLLDFAADILPAAADFFPTYQPTYLPVLETLCECIKGPTRPMPAANHKLNTLFFHAIYHPRDISRLTIRKTCEKHCEKVFKEEIGIDKFVVCYHRDKNLKESLTKSTYRDHSPNESVDEFFKNFNEN